MSLFPYDPTIWGQLCFDSTGNVFLEPRATPTNAQEALDNMPEGTRFRVISREVSEFSASVWAIQITDGSHERRLSDERWLYPTLWARWDATEERDDLTSYTHLLSYGSLEILPSEARLAVDVVVLVSPQNQPLQAHELPMISRRV